MLWAETVSTNFTAKQSLGISALGYRKKKFTTMIWIKELSIFYYKDKLSFFRSTLQWRHNERDSLSNHQSHDCLFKAQIKKYQSSASLAFVMGIHRWPANSPHKGLVTRKMFPFDDVIMIFVCELGPLIPMANRGPGSIKWQSAFRGKHFVQVWHFSQQKPQSQMLNSHWLVRILLWQSLVIPSAHNPNRLSPSGSLSPVD